jgi:hypothetical protein
MSESASVEVLSAEFRVIEVGNRHLTCSMYRQLDEATFERFEPFGRVRNNKRKPIRGVLHLVGRNTQTGALVRHNARPPRWTKREGPPEFAHWLRHQAEPSGYQTEVARHREFAIVWENYVSYRVCDAPKFWHVNDETPAWVRQLDRPRQVHMRQRRCKVDLDELECQWREKARSELDEMLKVQAKYEEFKALPLIVLAKLK